MSTPAWLQHLEAILEQTALAAVTAYISNGNSGTAAVAAAKSTGIPLLVGEVVAQASPAVVTAQ
jgi:hypothetical protein